MNNIEIERKYKITKEIYEEIITTLNQEHLSSKKESQNDIYFSPINFPFLGGEIDNECLRLRILKDKNILSYKKFIYATKEEPAHCIEHEIEILEPEKIKLILEDLRIKEEFTLKKERLSYIYKGKVEISLDQVDNLGYFIELEIINQSDLNSTLKELDEFISKFKITEEMRNYEGYSYMLYSQKVS